MKIAMDARALTAPKTGIGRYTENIAAHLLDQDEIRKLVLCSSREIEAGKRLSGDPKTSELISRGWKGNLWLQLVLPSLLKRISPDLFHATLFVPPLLSRCPCVVNIYDLTVYHYPESMQRKNLWLLKLLLGRAVGKAEKIITLSHCTKNEIAERWPGAAEKIVVIPGAAASETEGEAFAPRRDRPGDADRILNRYGVRRPYVLYAGTLEPRKNIVRMLAAFALFQKMGGNDVQFVLAGQAGWSMGDIRRVWEESPSRSAVRRLGYVPDDVLSVLYQNAEIFLYVSLYEGFGLPPLEAMAAGTCVLSSNRGSLSECLGEAALQVDPLAPEAIAEGLLRLHRDPFLRCAHIEKGFDRVQRYSWEDGARQTLQLYREVLGRTS